MTQQGSTGGAEGKTFTDKRIRLDGKDYRTCTFVNCTMIFSGVTGFGLDGCTLNGCTWVAEGPAATTLKVLAAMYQISPDTKEWVEQVFTQIRTNRFGTASS